MNRCPGLFIGSVTTEPFYDVPEKASGMNKIDGSLKIPRWN